jgi:hypothetical protein
MDIAADAGLDAIAPQAPPRAAARDHASAGTAPSFQDHLDAAHPKTNVRPNARPDTQRTDAQENAERRAARQTDETQARQEASQPGAGALAQAPQPALPQLIAAASAPTQQQGGAPRPEDSEARAPPPLAAAEQAAAATQPPASSGRPLKPASARSEETKDTKPEAAGDKRFENAPARPDAVAPPPTADAAHDASAEAAPAAPQLQSTLPAPQDASVGQGEAPIAAIQAAPRRTLQRAQAPQTSFAKAADAPRELDKTEHPLARTEATASATARQAAAQDSEPPAQRATAPAPQAAGEMMQAPAQTASLLRHAEPAPPAQAFGASASPAREAPPAPTQVFSEVVRRFNGHDTTFQLRLDPPELGRVNVRLDVTHDHRVTALITADTPQALSDLARGARDLQQALQSAGLDLADDGLRFDLSSNGNNHSFAQADRPASSASATPGAAADASAAPEAAPARPLRLDSWRGARIDLVA